jgi:hypothetical protein
MLKFLNKNNILISVGESFNPCVSAVFLQCVMEKLQALA